MGCALNLKPQSLLEGSWDLATRFLSSTLLPFSFWGLLIKTEYKDKGHPYYLGVTQEPRQVSLDVP